METDERLKHNHYDEHSGASSRDFRYLGNIWQQVVRDTLRVLSYLTGAMSSDWIEIAQQHSIPVLPTEKE